MDDIDINKAMANPVSVFGHPDNVVRNSFLTKMQKRDILLYWQSEAIHMQESDAEGFMGGERSHIDDINCALGKLA